MCIRDSYTATQCKKINDSCYVYHFPKNIAGVTELKVKGKKGTKLRLKHGELLDKNGMVDVYKRQHYGLILPEHFIIR